MSLFKKLSLLAAGLVLTTSPVLAQSSSESSQSGSSQTSYESLEQDQIVPFHKTSSSSSELKAKG